jgi:hypothetical protein
MGQQPSLNTVWTRFIEKWSILLTFFLSFSASPDKPGTSPSAVPSSSGITIPWASFSGHLLKNASFYFLSQTLSPARILPAKPLILDVINHLALNTAKTRDDSRNLNKDTNHFP